MLHACNPNTYVERDCHRSEASLHSQTLLQEEDQRVEFLPVMYKVVGQIPDTA